MNDKHDNARKQVHAGTSGRGNVASSPNGELLGSDALSDAIPSYVNGIHWNPVDWYLEPTGTLYVLTNIPNGIKVDLLCCTPEVSPALRYIHYMGEALADEFNLVMVKVDGRPGRHLQLYIANCKTLGLVPKVWYSVRRPVSMKLNPDIAVATETPIICPYCGLEHGTDLLSGDDVRAVVTRPCVECKAGAGMR